MPVVRSKHDTWPLLDTIAFSPIRRGRLETLQVNLGYRCNQTCVHCHTDSSPSKQEEMSGETVDLVLSFLERRRVPVLDITGGEPEMHPHFRRLVSSARAIGTRVIDRNNLTILETPGYEDLAAFLARERVEIVASMPGWREQEVRRQRGRGVFEVSISALLRLNALGYGRAGSGLMLDLISNPQDIALPAPRAALQAEYRRELGRHGIAFNRLITLTNMPIRRFGAALVVNGDFDAYMGALRAAHRDANLEHVMCRNLISVDWRGQLYDCDFNQMLDLPLAGRATIHLRDVMNADLEGSPIRVAGHCFGCTAGEGSRCGGALREAAE